MKTSRKSLIWLLTVVAMVCVLLFVGFNAKPAKADISDVDGITAEAKASVRLAEEPYGLRFKFDLTAEAVTRVLTEDKQLGALIIPYAFVTDYEASESTDGYHKWLTDNKEGKMIDLFYDEAEWVSVDSTTGAGTAYVAVTDILFNNVNLDFVAIPYVKDVTAGTYAYAEITAEHAKNIAEIAYAAVEETEIMEDLMFLSDMIISGKYQENGVSKDDEGKFWYKDAEIASMYDAVLPADYSFGYVDTNTATVSFDAVELDEVFAGYNGPVVAYQGTTELTATADETGVITIDLANAVDGASNLTIGLQIGPDAIMKYELPIVIYTDVIESAADLNAMGTTGYYILNGNVNCAGTTIANHATFSGTLDGCGYTFYNLNMASRVFEKISGATIKNVGFVNFERAGGGGGVLVLDAPGNNLYENVFLLGNHNGWSSSLGGLINSVGSGVTTVRNTVSYVEFKYMAQDPNGGVISANGAPTVMENNYFISSTSNNVLYRGGPAELGTNKIYTTKEAFNTEVAGWTETEDAIGAFSKDLWIVDNGMLMLKSAKSAIEDIISTGLITNTETTLSSGNSITLKGTTFMGSSVFELKEQVAGVTIENGVLKASESISEGTVTVVAKHSVYTNITKEYTVQLVPATKVAMDKVEYFMENGDFSYDLTELGLTSVISVAIDGASITGYTFDNNTIVIPVAKFAGNNQTVVVMAKAGNDVYEVTIPVYAINYLIDTVAEFTGLGSKIDAKGLYGKVVALGANLDFKGATVNQIASSFNGTFDGRGYALSNFTLTNRLFTYSYCGTFKNLAFVNVKNASGYGGLLFADHYANGQSFPSNHITVENMFIHFSKFTTAGNSGIITRDYIAGTMSNVVIVIDGAVSDATYGVIAPSATSKPTLNNVYVVSSNATKLLGSSTDSTGIYASQSALNEVVAGFAVTDTAIGTFGKDLWTVENGSLVMKSALAEEAVNITNVETSIYSGNSITLTADRNVTWSLESAVDGASISGNVLTLEAGVSASSVTVVATYTKTVAGVNVVTTDKVTFDIISVTTVNKATAVYGANRTPGAFTYDLSEYNMEAPAVTLDGAQFTAFTFADGILTIERANLSNGKKLLTVNGNNYLINIPLEVADWAIGTADELTAWGVALTQHSGNIGTFTGRAILTAHIDYNNQDWQAKSGGTRYMSGEFDGRGYTISNLKSIGSPMFYSIDQGDLNNVAFENLYVEYTHCMITHRANGSTFKNIYVQGIWNQPSMPEQNTGAFGWATYPPAGDVNVVMIVEKQYQGQPDTTASGTDYYFVGHGSTNCSNIFVEMQYSNGKVSTNVANGTLYETAGSLNADAANIVAKLNNSYWKVVDGAVKLVPIA